MAELGESSSYTTEWCVTEASTRRCPKWTVEANNRLCALWLSYYKVPIIADILQTSKAAIFQQAARLRLPCRDRYLFTINFKQIPELEVWPPPLKASEVKPNSKIEITNTMIKNTRLFSKESDDKEISDWLSQHEITKCPTINPLPPQRSLSEIKDAGRKKWLNTVKWQNFRKRELQRRLNNL